MDIFRVKLENSFVCWQNNVWSGECNYKISWMTLIFSVTAEESITHCIVLLPKRIPYIMKRMVCGTKLKTIDIRTLMVFSYVNISLFSSFFRTLTVPNKYQRNT